MISFSELSISPDRSQLNISCACAGTEYISSITLEYFENYSSEGPSDKAVTVVTYNDQTHTAVEASVTLDDLEGIGTDTFIDSLFYVYVAYGTVGEEATKTDTAVILDWEKVYVEAMSYLKQLATDCGNCKDNQELLDFILRWEALKLAIATCDWDTVHCMWIQLFHAGSINVADCGCGN